MWLLPISMLVVTILLAIPLSRYMSWIMDGKYRAPRPCGGLKIASTAVRRVGSNTHSPCSFSIPCYLSLASSFWRFNRGCLSTRNTRECSRRQRSFTQLSPS